jgi:hypothetical protein
MPSGNMQLTGATNHSPVKEYRVNKDGEIEARILDSGSEQESDWREVSSEKLSSQVRSNAPVTRWLDAISAILDGDGYYRLALACKRVG